MVMILVAPALLVIALLLIWQGGGACPSSASRTASDAATICADSTGRASSGSAPECGSDVGKPGTVRYADYRRSPRRIVAGIVLIGLCVLGFAGEQFYRAYRYRHPSVQSNSRLIANLKTSANTPWDWQELEKRYNAGRLSGSEASAAIEQLIAYLKANPSPKSGPLYWADRFFALALKGGHISDEQLKRLCDAYYGTIRLSTAESGSTRRQAPNRHCGIRPLGPAGRAEHPGPPPRPDRRQTREVVPRWTEGKSRDYLSCDTTRSDRGRNPDRRSAPANRRCSLSSTGACWTRKRRSPSLRGKPGQAERWPQTLVRRVLTAKVPIEVVPADVSPVKLVTDPASDPSSRRR